MNNEVKTGRPVKGRKKKHGMRTHKMYDVWNAMLQRTTNSNHKQWKNYGGRDVNPVMVCDAWKDFRNFYKDMHDDYREGLMIDRKSNSDGYHKENCRWVTPKQSLRNKLNTIYVEYCNFGWNLAELCEDLNMPYNVVWKRIFMRGWSVRDAIDVPVGGKRYKPGAK